MINMRFNKWAKDVFKHQLKCMVAHGNRPTEICILEAYTRDVGHPVAKMDEKTANMLGLAMFDKFKLNYINENVRKIEKVREGKYPEVMQIFPLYPSDQGKMLVRIDKKERNHTKTKHGQMIYVYKEDDEV